MGKRLGEGLPGSLVPAGGARTETARRGGAPFGNEVRDLGTGLNRDFGADFGRLRFFMPLPQEKTPWGWGADWDSIREQNCRASRGSNCFPAHRRISDRASLGVRGVR